MSPDKEPWVRMVKTERTPWRYAKAIATLVLLIPMAWAVIGGHFGWVIVIAVAMLAAGWDRVWLTLFRVRRP